ncbi:MAG: hypothetical protein EOO10_01685 [Chitinophagaceae bacterium]|nr:MAG: hypothetical protein EOO10_01685 [Chitinophagaceae bacterium]
MSYQLFNDANCIRIQQTLANNETKVLMVSKEQIRTIDIVKTKFVRIDIGEGALKNIFLNYQEVTFPTVHSADELRDHINALMKSEIYDGDAPKEATLEEVSGRLGGIDDILRDIQKQGVSVIKLEPIFVDESNPNAIYKGWATVVGIGSEPIWAIQKISQVDDLITHEWADGNRFYDNIWDNRLQLQYAPFLADSIIY